MLCIPDVLLFWKVLTFFFQAAGSFLHVNTCHDVRLGEVFV